MVFYDVYRRAWYKKSNPACASQKKTQKHNMPSTLRIGSEVSSIASRTAPFLPPAPGKRRRQRQRVYGVIQRSLPNNKWEVLWGNGEKEECAPGTLKDMGGGNQTTNEQR